VVTHLFHLLVAGVLGLCVCLCGCAQSSQASKLHVGFTLDPLGVEVGVETIPVVTAGAPQSWTLGNTTMPTTVPNP
jgi:hypothetical protein